MAWGRAALGLALAAVLAVVLVSGGSEADSVRREYIHRSNRLKTIVDYGRAQAVHVQSLGKPLAMRGDPAWLARARPLGPEAPRWARRLYRRSLLVLRALADARTGAVVAGLREGWEYVWPRDAGAVALAFAAAGYRGEARRIARFLLRLDLGAAARFFPDGTPVPGRPAQGDATGWVTVAARAAGVQAAAPFLPWRDRADYQEGESGDLLGNALASAAAGPQGTSAGVLSARRRESLAIQKDFLNRGVLVRERGDPSSKIDSAAAWAVRPFPQPALFPAARRTLLRLAAGAGRYGIVPSESWNGGNDPWTAPTAWTAWSLAALGERRAALGLMAALRRDATPVGLLPERIDAHAGIPASTTPLAWSQAFAILALRELWPRAGGATWGGASGRASSAGGGGGRARPR